MKIFISYSHIDSEIADKLSQILNKTEIDFFLDKKNIKWGENLQEKIIDELDNKTTHIIPIISPASIKSQWVVYEIITAKNKNITILPFLTHPSMDIPFFLKDLKYTSKLEDIDNYFNGITHANSLNIKINFTTNYGKIIEFEGNRYQVTLDEKEDELDLSVSFPILTLEVVNTDKNIINLETPLIEFIKPHTTCIIPKQEISGFSFGSFQGRIIPLRPKGKFSFTLNSMMFLEFYEALIKDNVECIKVSDETNISANYTDIKKLKKIITDFFDHSVLMEIKKNVIKDRTNFC